MIGHIARRAGRVFLPLLLGLAAGIASDFLLRDPLPTMNEVGAAILFSPLTIVIGSAAVAPVGWTVPLFFLGGLMFWPGLLGLVVFAIRATRPRLLMIATGLWCFQGCFLLVHRLRFWMSV